MNPKNYFRSLSDSWLKEKSGKVKISTMAAYRVILEKYLIPYFEPLEEIREKDLQNFIDMKLSQGLSVKSIKDILVVMKMVLRYAYGAEDPLVKNFQAKLPPYYKNKDMQVFSVYQQKILLDYLYSSFSFKNLGILICLNTGMRIGEICALKWNDVDLIQGTVSVNKTLFRLYHVEKQNTKSEVIISTPKTFNSYRIIPLPQDLCDLLKKIKPLISRDYFVISNKPKPMEPRTYRNYYRKLLQELKLPYIKFHGLRHSFATRCIESQCDYKSVSVILGHADISTTLNLYVHPTLDQKKNCIEKMLKSLNSNL